MISLSFHGGAGEVTGACYLLEIKNKKSNSKNGESLKILVDCGLFQGGRFVEKRNYQNFSFDPASIDFLLVTHAHIDHTGRIPKLVRGGFKGKIYSTGATKDFAALLLEDSLGVISKEAKGHKEKILYSLDDLEETLGLWEGIHYREIVELVPGITFRFLDAGHILGSAMVEITIIQNPKSKIQNSIEQSQKILFTGDLGNPPTPLLKPTEPVEGIHWLIMESVYGDRFHEDRKERKLLLERIIEDAVHQGGVLMIPAFALERTQELLFELNELVEHHRIPRILVFIDSPLAAKATEIYRRHSDYFNKEARYIMASGDDLFKFPGLKLTPTTEESKAINDVAPPKIVIAGSGMSTGGRILHHERRYLQDPKSTILLIGYQVRGTLGRQLVDGSKQVTIMGEVIPVRARVAQISGYSAHPDREGLLDFASQTRETLKKIFLVQGEAAAAKSLRVVIRDKLGVACDIPRGGSSVELEL